MVAWSACPRSLATIGKPHSGPRTNAGDRMAEVMYAEAVESGAPRYRAPRALQVRAWFLSFRARSCSMLNSNSVAAHPSKSCFGLAGSCASMTLRGPGSRLPAYFQPAGPRSRSRSEPFRCRALSRAHQFFPSGKLGTGAFGLRSIAAAIVAPMVSTARRNGSASRCAYLCVVEACEWPRSFPMIGRPSDAPAPKLAKE